MSCKGLHCSGCGSGKGAGLAVLAVVIVGAAVYHVATSPAVEHAAGLALTIAAVTVASLVGLAVLGGLTWAGLAVRRRLAARAGTYGTVTYRAEPASLPAQEYPPLRLVSARALPAGGRRRPLDSSQEPAGARRRPGRGKR